MRRQHGLLLVFALAGCGSNSGSPAEQARPEEEEGARTEHSTSLSPEAQKVSGVETTIVRYQLIQETLDVPGIVSSTSKGRAVVTPPTPGRIVSLSVQLGDSVRQGQTLAVIESTELAQAWANIADSNRSRDAASADLRGANAEVDLAQAKLDSARESLRRQKEFVQAGAFSQAPLQQAQNALNEAQSERLGIQKEFASHSEQLRRLESLFRDGIVSKSELEQARLELQQDQIKLDRSKAVIDNARETYDREKNIASRGLLNAKELQAAEADVRASKLELDRSRIRAKSAAASVQGANRALANAQAIYRVHTGSGGGSVGRVELIAPIAGIVSRLDVTRGQAVDRTQALLEIENLASVWVSANVAERDASRVRKGDPVRVTAASLPGKEFPGVVQVVGARVDAKTRSVPMACLIAGGGGQLKPEMFATVSMGLGVSSRQLVVPLSAIVTEDAKSFVYVKVADAFEKREVQLGARSGSLVGVKGGLREGDVVASKGTFVLTSEFKKDELKGEE